MNLLVASDRPRPAPHSKVHWRKFVGGLQNGHGLASRQHESKPRLSGLVRGTDLTYLRAISRFGPRHANSTGLELNYRHSAIAMNTICIPVSLRVFALGQYAIVVALLAICTVMYLFRAVAGDGASVDFFDVNSETSLPTYFSLMNLLVGAVLTGVVAALSYQQKSNMFRYWVLLALLFAYMSIDEAAMVHEKFIRFYRAVDISIPEIESHGWLLLGSILAVLVGSVFVPFLFSLPRWIAGRFFLAGSIFLTGAIGFEFVGALMYHTGYAERGELVYELRRIAEEGCEMFAIAFFNCTVLRALVTTDVRLALRA